MENVQEQVQITVLVMKCMQGLDTCVGPGVYNQVLHHQRLNLIPSNQVQLKEEVQEVLDRGFYLTMKETIMTDRR